jgi:hypothetical protein
LAALGNALEHVGLRLEEGIQEAERELFDLRRHCRALESMIRSIRAALEAPEAPPAVFDAPDVPVLILPNHASESLERVEVIEEVPPADPPDPPADPPADPSTDPPIAAIDTSVSSYMPMLEELWAIARREDD